MSDAPEREPDGFHHPASEEELVALVRLAHREGRQLRVRGSAHSISHAIYTDPLDGFDNRVLHQSPPAGVGSGINVMLDRYRGWRVRDEARKLVEADAGIHLGPDPGDPTGGASQDTSLLGALAAERGWGLLDTGGITHQTVSGFTATGSSGGSMQYTSNENLWGFRVIDGTGEVYEVTREDADPDLFWSMSPNLGLLGVVSKIVFECVDDFAVSGQEATTSIEGCAIDLFGPGSAGRPSLEEFFRRAEFARVEWWPQRGGERALTWQAQRLRAQPGFRPTRYRRFGEHPVRTQHLIALLYTVLGNLDDLSRARARLEDDFDHLSDALEALAEARNLGRAGRVLAEALGRAAELGIDAALTVLEPAAPLIKRELPDFFPKMLDAFIPVDAERKGFGRGEPQAFRDWAWRGLPMDNAASDVLMPTGFTEAWVPIGRTRQAMVALRDYFAAPEDEGESYRRTGTHAWELYAAMPTKFWLSPGYTTGDDEWSEGTFRIDPYWFAEGAEDPSAGLFAGLWQTLRDSDIPFRLHWGKYQPTDPAWIDYLRAQYPRWDDFLALRAKRDPEDIFLTSYWRHRLGL